MTAKEKEIEYRGRKLTLRQFANGWRVEIVTPAQAAHSNIDVSRIGRSNRPREKDRERGPLRPGPARLTGTGGWFTHHRCSGAIGGTSSSSPCQCFTGSARSEASRAAASGGVRLRQWSLCEGAALWSASRPSKRGRVGEDNSSARPVGGWAWGIDSVMPMRELEAEAAAKTARIACGSSEPRGTDSARTRLDWPNLSK